MFFFFLPSGINVEVLQFPFSPKFKTGSWLSKQNRQSWQVFPNIISSLSNNGYICVYICCVRIFAGLAAKAN